MTAEQLLTYARRNGISLFTDNGQLKFKAPLGTVTPEITAAIKTHKQEIIGILTGHLEGGRPNPGDCDHCPAAGLWEWYGPGTWCFHTAYYQGKAAHPKACEIARHNCPIKTETASDSDTEKN